MALNSEYDVIILGGGPAGIAAAIWCADLGLKALLVEQEKQLGGQLLRTYAPIKNYPGIGPISGEALRDRFLKSLSGSSFELRVGENSTKLDLSNKTLEFENGEMARGDALIIATGVRRQKLGVPGEEKFVGHGILSSGSKDKELVKGSKVVIIGGGDAALENALILSDHASQVFVVHRRHELSARSEFLDAANARSNVEFRLSHTVKSFFGDGRLAGVEVEAGDGSVWTIDASYALVRIGVIPNTEMFRDELMVDARGYIKIAQYCETSRVGVYAVGDVAFPISPTIASAVGSAATACKHILSTFDNSNSRSPA